MPAFRPKYRTIVYTYIYVFANVIYDIWRWFWVPYKWNVTRQSELENKYPNQIRITRRKNSFFLIVSFLCRNQSSLIRSSANFIVHIQWPLCPIQQTRGSSRSGHKFLLLHIKIFLCHCSRNCNNSKTVWVTWKQQLPLPQRIPVRQLENLLFIICIQVLKNFDELWWLFDIFVYLVCCLCILCVMRIDAFAFVCMCTVESSTPHLSMTQLLLFFFMFIYDRQMMKP